MNGKTLRILLLALSSSGIALSLPVTSAVAAEKVAQQFYFNIEPQSVETALLQFSTQADMQVMVGTTTIAGQHTKGIKGRLDATEALSALLRDTGLTFKTDGNTVTVVSVSTATTDNTVRLLQRHVLAASHAPAGMSAVKQPTSEDLKALASDEKNLDEVVVTGSHIRGISGSASPVQILTRDDIDRTGLGTVSAFIERMPQNFAGASENTMSAVAGGATAGAINNSVGASSVNLRGLGNTATLILINGRRIAAGGANGNIVDVSLIPLGAVDRIEVVTDGASAIYGSDAVGGVVNFIMREDFDGAETRLRYGSVSDGDLDETQVGQAFGKSWTGGSALISYEYFDKSALSARDRDYSNEVTTPFSLLPGQTRQGVFASARQIVANKLQMFADGWFSDKSSSTDASIPITQRTNADIKTYGAALGGRLPLGTATAELSSSYTNSTSDIRTLQAGVLTNTRKARSDIASIDATLDGTFKNLFAGNISYAIGGQLRREEFDIHQTVPTTSRFQPDRDVAGAFIELRIPILQGTAANAGRDRLQLTLADRYEHYSDYGTTNNPQAGLIWSALPSLTLRGTIGTSFRAPTLNDLDPVPYAAALYPQFDPRGASGSCAPFNSTNTCATILALFGGNPDLVAEKARSWTVGFDWTPVEVNGLSIMATYYDITFDDRIVSPSAKISFLDALRFENTLGPIIQRNPSQQYLQQLAALPGYSNFFGLSLSNVAAIVDMRTNNLASDRTSGLDLSASLRSELPRGSIEFGVDGTYIFKLENKFIDATDVVKTLNTPYNPIDLRARARFIYQQDAYSVSSFVNYADSYVDNRGGTQVPVSSWTTIDLNVGYRIDDKPGPFDKLSFMLGVTNITNKEPPFLSNPSFNINFDGTNANALGRFWYMQLSKSW